MYATATIVGTLKGDGRSVLRGGQTHNQFTLEVTDRLKQSTLFLVDVRNIKDDSKQVQYLRDGKEILVTGNPTLREFKGQYYICIETTPAGVQFLLGKRVQN